MSHKTPLQGQGVLVTRPAHQAKNFIQQLKACGANAIGFPCIEIHPITESTTLDMLSNKLDQYHTIIFISSNAVENGLKWIEKSPTSIKNIKIAAIGKTTKAALEHSGFSVIISPEHDFNSEALLNLDEFSENEINHKPVLIVKGEGGREYLQHTLCSRGAQVDLANVYRRDRPDADIRPLLELWSQHQIHWVTVTSNETLKNLYYMLNEQGQNWLTQTQLLVPSQRCQQLAQQLGFNKIILSTSASDAAMLNAIKQNIQY